MANAKLNPTDCLEYLMDEFFPVQPKYTQLIMTRKAWAKMLAYANLAGKYEITGFARIVDGKIVDVKILEQVVKSATVDASTESMLKFLMELPKEERGQWVLDWHSHVDMGVFESGTDEDNYNLQFEARARQQFPYMIINKSGERYCRCYCKRFKKTPINIVMDNDTITKDELEAIYNECKSEVAEKCSYTMTYTYTTNTGFGYKPTTLTFGKKKEEKSIEKIGDEHCMSCKAILVNSGELNRGLCDDCWDAMTWTEQTAFCQSLGITYSQAMGWGGRVDN